MKKHGVLVINLNNNQSSYARCLDIIEHIELFQTSDNMNELYQIVTEKMMDYSKSKNELFNHIDFSLKEQIRGGSKRYFEEPLLDSNNNKLEVLKPISVRSRKDKFITYAQEGEISYHIRVHFNNGHCANFSELHYLVMLLINCKKTFHSLKNGDLESKLTVFLVPTSGESYPYISKSGEIDTKLYENASSYLRLITKSNNGVIFGLADDNGDATVKTLDFASFIRSEKEFPLLYIEQSNKNTTINYLDKSKQNHKNIKSKKNCIDNYDLIFNSANMPDNRVMRKAFEYRLNSSVPFNYASDENPNVALADFILDTARERLLFEFASVNSLTIGDGKKIDRKVIMDIGRKNIKEYINDILSAMNNINRMTFAIFAFLLDVKDINDKDLLKYKIKNIGTLASELSLGIKQLIQNSLQHSEYHNCFITFYKTSSNELHVIITDLNKQSTIVENFVLRLENEKRIINKEQNMMSKMLKGYQLLLENKSKIKVENLFSFFNNNDDKNIWFYFRQSDISAHIGLTLFSQTAWRCNAKLRVISNNELLIKSENVFVYDYLNEKQIKQSFDYNSQYVIPGTQIDFIIPIKLIENESINNGIVQLSTGRNTCENYEAYAEYIDYDCKALIENSKKDELLKFVNTTINSNISKAIDKFNIQSDWTVYLISLFEKTEEKQLNFISAKEFPEFYELLKNDDYCEILVKSIFSSIINLNSNKKIFLALLNFSDNFVRVFKSLSSSSLSLMRFPKNVQLFVSNGVNIESEMLSKTKYQIVFFGSSIGSAVQNSYILSLEQGVQSFTSSEYVSSINLLNLFETQVLADVNHNNIGNYLVMPFSSLINENNLPDYFNRMKFISELPMVDEKGHSLNKGYKFSNTHMRLGNKVHTEEFYEMSFLFYRTIVSNRVAFHILQKMLKDGIIAKVLKDDMNIVFYGYASYSQAIIMSLTEMLKIYMFNLIGDVQYNNKIFYASYQYNLQTSSSSANIHVHRNNMQKIDNSVVIQIVPISSTLTTFDKMWAEYFAAFKEEKPKLLANYTVYLVRHQQRNNFEDMPLDSTELSNIEKKYWNLIDVDKRIIELNKSRFNNIETCNYVNFIISGGSHWHTPKRCHLCYPKSVFFEMPLVETDPTSTVPSQQIHSFKKVGNFNKDNINRIKALYGCVYYGHFSRSKNHFQYYINTQKYFAESESKIKQWLILEKEKTQSIQNETKPILNIIFSPEHNTNVGFSQYVNAYYFNGSAEIVSVNEDKQFRSNFVCENDAIKQTIKRLFCDFPEIEKPVRFFFADDNIVSGETFRKASNLLQSLIPDEYREIYGTNVFEKCFFLIDRLSYSTKESYVIKPESHFLSYCKINISNMRTHGDSCVGCKLEKEANHLFRRSSTKKIANYWARKSIDYMAVPFDSEYLKNYDDFKSYVRLVLSHIIQKKISSMNNITSGEFFDWSLSMINYFIDDKDSINTNIDIEIQEYIKHIISISSDDKTNLYLVKTFIKLLARPFYTFDYSIRTQIMRLVIVLCEILLDNNNSFNCPKSSYPEHKEIEWFYSYGTRWNDVINFSLRLKNELLKSGGEVYCMHFIQECLFEALADIRSTYLLRKSTLKKVQLYLKRVSESNLEKCSKCNMDHYNYNCRKRPVATFCSGDLIKCFWNQYAINLHRIIDTNSDETKALWLEHLLLTGYEWGEEITKDTFGKNSLYESVLCDNGVSYDILFKDFCDQIFLQNTRLIFDGLEKIHKKSLKNNATDVKNINDDSDMANPYFMDNYIESREIAKCYIKKELPNADHGEIELFNTLYSNSISTNNLKDSIVDKRYFELLRAIKNMISDKYVSIKPSDINIALLTGTEEIEDKKYVLDIIRTDFDDQYGKITVSEDRVQKWAKMKSIIKERIYNAINKSNYSDCSYEGDINELGYYLVNTDNIETNDYLVSQSNNYYSEHDSYHKPYFILLFNNDKCDDNYKLGRKIKSIADVYIYVSIIIPDKNKRNTLPWLIMRDILAYRNRLMEYFEEDFNSDIIQRSFRSFQEKTILEHEKATSHSSTMDDSVCMKIFKGVNNKESNATDEQLLLLRNYTNVTISKLFNRSFHKDETEFEYNIKTPPQDVPELYLEKDIDGNELKRRLIRLSDLDIVNDIDNRFRWLNNILDIKINYENDPILINSNISQDDNLIKPIKYYNLEYMKCIILDILLSAAKSKTLEYDFLQSMKLLADVKKYSSNTEKFAPMPKTSSIVYFTRTKTCGNENFDYLTILNSVKSKTNLTNTTLEILNQEIHYHLTDPIDYPGGHMSLLTIKRYIEGLNKKVLNGKTNFKFCKYKDINNRYSFVEENDEFWFETNLPILEKE